MDDKQPRFQPGSRVRLRDGIDSSFYLGMAKVGNEGWITQQRKDRFGLPEVYIQWDPTHWAYNRQPDGWTFEDHFEPISEDQFKSGELMNEEPQRPPNEVGVFGKIMAELIEKHLGGKQPDPVPSEPAPVPNEPIVKAESPGEHFVRMLEKSIAAISDAEGFVTIAVSRQEHPNSPQGELVVHIVGDSVTPEADVLVGSQLSALGSKYHQEAALMCIADFTTRSHE